MAHQIAAHRLTRICEDSGYPKRASSQGALMSFRTHINLLAITGCECGIEVICKSPGCLRSISKTSALLYLKPGRKRRLDAADGMSALGRYPPFTNSCAHPKRTCDEAIRSWGNSRGCGQAVGGLKLLGKRPIEVHPVLLCGPQGRRLPLWRR